MHCWPLWRRYLGDPHAASERVASRVEPGVRFLVDLAPACDQLRPLFGGSAELGFGGGKTIPVARRHVAELGRRLGCEPQSGAPTLSCRSALGLLLLDLVL